MKTRCFSQVANVILLLKNLNNITSIIKLGAKSLVLKAPFIGTSGGVSSEHPLASVAGFKALAEGGNAVDATVAVSLSLAVTQQHLGSLGGDFFALIYESSSGKVYCLNSSGWSPKRLNVEYLLSEGFKDIPVNCPHSIVVPGMVEGLRKIHERFGTLEFRRLAEYSIHLAEDGFPVSYGFSKAIKDNASKLAAQETRNLFFRKGEPLMPNDIFVQKSLAKTLKSVASDPRSFYDGWIAESLCKFIKSKGGVMEIDDFKDFSAEWVDPLKITYRDFDVYEIPPNSQGAVTLMILNLLENFDLNSIEAFNAERVHIFAEAAKVAYTEKNRYLADPRFTSIPLDEILSKGHAKKLKDRINLGDVYPQASLKPYDTTNFVVIDKLGNVVSAIQSVFHFFGSGFLDPDTGILLNDRGSYFNFKGPNKLEPRKRPLHTLSSVIATSHEDVVLAVGTSGGDFRPQLHALLLTNILNYGMRLQEAVEAPRFLWNGGKQIIMEEGVKGLESLKKLGHEITLMKYPSRLGVVHGGLRSGKATTLSADIRGDGIPFGL
jgi:gamma-glutamyltranspeptidase/glutathione hydrolase